MSVVSTIKKTTRYIFIALLALILLALLGMEGFDRYLSSDAGIRHMFRKSAKEVQVKRTSGGLRYLEIGDPHKPALFLLHGSPGSALDWRSLARDSGVYEVYRLLIPERPGYGGSKPRGAEPSIHEQAQRCIQVLENETQPVLIAGYSYGAPVGLAIAGMQPEKVQRFVGAAGQYDPEQEMVFRISPWLRFGLFRYLLPRWLWVSNVEKLGHANALMEAYPQFQAVRCPVDLIHGYPDAIVPHGNSVWLQQQLNDSVRLYSLRDIGHEMPFRHMDTLIRFVLNPEAYF